MTGTFGGALEARHIPAGDGRLLAEAVGEVELDGDTLVIRRIHAHYRLRVDPGVDRQAVDRVLAIHADHCPVARSLRGAIEVTTSVELLEG
ncbi:MAG: OsmC family protein [Acidimicrobiales bacterium]